MSVSQFLALCFAVDTGSTKQHDSIGGIGLQLSPKDQCERAITRLTRATDESHQILRDTARASKLLKASSEAVIQCLTCPKAFESGFESKKDLP